MHRTPGRIRGRLAALLGVPLVAGLLATAPAVATGGEAPIEEASFVDPTARLQGPVELGDQVYVGPFARLEARDGAPIRLGAESNVQDNATVEGGVETGERVILAPGAAVRGPAQRGGGEPGDPATDSGVFLSFGALVGGAVLERDTAVSALARVGPGVTLRSGTLVLPGKDVRTQAEADDRTLGKVRDVTEADRLFNAGVIEVNVGLAREYTRLQREDPSAVRGINVDPGGNAFDPVRDAPTVGSAACDGQEAREPGFRNRIIGDVCLADPLRQLDERLGDRIAVRADEGGPFRVGAIDRMGDGVVFHALEGSGLTLGDRVRYGAGAIVRGGGRPSATDPAHPDANTVVGDDVHVGAGAVVFRSLLPDGVRVGERSAVVSSERLTPGQVIPDRTVYLGDEVFGPVEW